MEARLLADITSRGTTWRRHAAAGMLLVLALPTVLFAQVEKSRYFSAKTQVQILQAVVRVRVHLPGNQGCKGSAVCIGTDADGWAYLLTCHHVMKNARQPGAEVTFETFTGSSYPDPARKYVADQFQLWSDPKLDLALLRVRADVPQTVRVWSGRRKLPKGAALLDVGCGKGAPPVCQIGELVGLDKRKDLVFSRGGIGGRSGGLLYARGGMVGVHARGSDGRSSAVHYRKINRFLRDCGIVKQVPVVVEGKKQYQVVLKAEPAQS